MHKELFGAGLQCKATRMIIEVKRIKSKTKEKVCGCFRAGSNRRPLAHKTSALTTELQKRAQQQQ